MVAEGSIDATDVLVEPSDPGPMVFAFRQPPSSNERNPTGWVFRIIAPRAQFDSGRDGCATS
jgi:hypothetical protein